MLQNLRPDVVSAGSNLRVLDLGPGQGAMVHGLAEQGHLVVALDRDRALGGKIAREGASPVIVGDAERVPFRDASFDRVLMIELLEHVEVPERVLIEARRVLTSWGVAVVAVPTSYTERFYARVHPRYAQNATHVRTFNRTQLFRLAEATGFEICGVDTRNFAAAVSWLVHALLRTDADHTGRVLQHAGVDSAILRGLAYWRRIPGARRALVFLERRVGKSWYVYLRPIGA